MTNTISSEWLHIELTGEPANELAGQLAGMVRTGTPSRHGIKCGEWLVALPSRQTVTAIRPGTFLTLRVSEAAWASVQAAFAAATKLAAEIGGQPA